MKKGKYNQTETQATIVPVANENTQPVSALGHN